MSDKMVISCTPFSCINIHNIKSIRCTKVKKMVKILVFGCGDHSNRHLLWHSNDSLWLNTMAKSFKSFSSIKICDIESIRCTNSRKWPKSSHFWLFGSFKGIFVIFEWSSMGDITSHMSTSFRIIKICNLKSVWSTKLEQEKPKAESSVFGRKMTKSGALT